MGSLPKAKNALIHSGVVRERSLMGGSGSSSVPQACDQSSPRAFRTGLDRLGSIRTGSGRFRRGPGETWSGWGGGLVFHGFNLYNL